MERGIGAVKSVFVVISGKGGVGKSTVACQLAIGLSQKNLRVGLLDVDLCGPSIPRILGLENAQVDQCPAGWLPVVADTTTKNLLVMSIGFLLPDKNSAVVWRGPKKTSMIDQLLGSVCWGSLDAMIIDTPPGTSDEHLAVVEKVREFAHDRLKGCIVVTTPQVCELDIIFHFEKAYFVLDELLLAGELQETSKEEIVRDVDAQDILQEKDCKTREEQEDILVIDVSEF